MPHMTVLRFTRDEDGRDKVCEDVAIAAAHAKDYPWPPPEAVVRVQTTHKDPASLMNWVDIALYGQDASAEPEHWADVHQYVRLALHDRLTDDDDPMKYRAMHFRRHSFSQVDPREEGGKGHHASGALYVLVEELEPLDQLDQEVEVTILPLADVREALRESIKADPVPRQPITEEMIGKALDKGWITHPQAEDVRYLLKQDLSDEERTCLAGEKIQFWAADRALIPGHVSSQLEAKEYGISGYCGHCWNRMFKPGWTDPITGEPGETPIEDEDADLEWDNKGLGELLPEEEKTDD
jgi:hypothetical protein